MSPSRETESSSPCRDVATAKPSPASASDRSASTTWKPSSGFPVMRARTDRSLERDPDGDALPCSTSIPEGTSREIGCSRSGELTRTRPSGPTSVTSPCVFDSSPLGVEPVRHGTRSGGSTPTYRSSSRSPRDPSGAPAGSQRTPVRFGRTHRPSPLAFPVGEDDQSIRPEHRRRTGDVAEFASRLASIFGLPDDRRGNADRESIFGTHRGETVPLDFGRHRKRIAVPFPGCGAFTRFGGGLGQSIERQSHTIRDGIDCPRVGISSDRIDPCVRSRAQTGTIRAIGASASSSAAT